MGISYPRLYYAGIIFILLPTYYFHGHFLPMFFLIMTYSFFDIFGTYCKIVRHFGTYISSISQLSKILQTLSAKFKYTDQEVFVSKYLFGLPSVEELKKLIEADTRKFEENK